MKLADFGLLTEAGPRVSRVGTQTYMPPDGRMDARADVYAAGLVLYEMLGGLPAESFPRLGGRAREIVSDPTLGALLKLSLRACEPDPEKRFPDARAMLDALEKRIQAAPTSRFRRSRRAALVAAGLLLACGPVAAGYWWHRVRPVHVNFVTDPFEATVWLDGVLQTDADGNPYKTPCTIENLPPRAHEVVFRLAGRNDLKAGSRDFGDERRVVGRWPAGRSD